jgi:drug/metabolite transporter (DMT)-like permease
VIFRIFERFKINVFQGIVYNYITACSVGFLIFGDEWKPGDLDQGTWIPYVFIVGALFISLFVMMGKSSQENGIGITSVTVKMSLAIPVIAAIFLYNESIYLTKVIGIIAALIGVFLITYQKKKSSKKGKRANVLFLIVLFVGSGLLDSVVNYVEKVAAGELSLALFSAIGFGVAASLGLVFMLIKVLRKDIQLQKRAILGGILLGIPNFFSIYFLMMAIRFSEFSDSVTYALNNTGVVIASFAVGIIAFKESTTPLKILGGVIAIAAILLLTL